VGDFLMMTPALKALSKEMKVNLLLPEKSKATFENLDFINKLYSIEEKIDQKKFDCVFDLNDYEFNYEQIYHPTITKPKQEIFADALGVKINSVNPIIKLTKEEENWINQYLKKKNPDAKKIILCAVQSSNPSRDWSIKKWEELIKRLKKLDYKIIVADPNINWEDQDIVFFNHHTLREFFALASKADFIITLDSGLLHIGAAFNKLSLGIFGPTDPKIRCIYDNSHYIHKNLDCEPCWYSRCVDISCMKLLTVDQVESSFLQMLENGIKS